MFACLQSENDIDDFISAHPKGLADVGDFLQTVVESDRVRVDLKRAACLVELHRAHYVDVRHADASLGLPPRLVRLYFETLDEIVDAYLVGSLDEREFVAQCEVVRTAMLRLHAGDARTRAAYHVMAGFAESSRAGTMRGFDSRFTRLVAKAYASRRRHEKQEGDDDAGDHERGLASG